MEAPNKASQKFNLLFGVLLALASLLPSFGAIAAEPAQTILVVNPYADVDWRTFERHKANFHTHTTQSDGRFTPDQAIDAYKEKGYSILAITDHGRCTWPWTELSKIKRSGKAEQGDKAAAGDPKFNPKDCPPVPAYKDRDPASLKMLAVSGNEIYPDWHEVLSLFAKYQLSGSMKPDQALSEVDAAGGLAIFCHPGRYWKLANGAVPDEVALRYSGWFERHKRLLGFEVFNQGNRYPQDKALWDALLSKMMPERPVWGFANDDMHGKAELGRNWNTLVVRSLDEAEVRKALERGQFYFSTVATHDKSSRDPDQTPVIKSIVYDAAAGTIAVDATSGGEKVPAEKFRWFSNGELVCKGPVLDCRNESLGSYVRLEIEGKGGTSFTNPFGLRQPKEKAGKQERQEEK